jgi:hypothetical protein
MTYGELTVGLKLVAARNGVGGFEPEERRSFLVFVLHLELKIVSMWCLFCKLKSILMYKQEKRRGTAAEGNIVDEG